MMKKHLITLCLMTVALVAFTACSEKESDMVTLTVNFETPFGAKGYIDEVTHKPMIVTGDSAHVNDGVFAFDFENGDPILRVNHALDNRYRAIFPARIVLDSNIALSDTVHVNIPRDQHYSTQNGVQKVDMPMISYPEGYSLWFRNICSLVRVNVTNTTNRPLDIRFIEVSINNHSLSDNSSVFLSGYTRLNVSTSVPTIDMATSEYHFVRLYLDEHPDALLPVGQSRAFYLIVAPLQTTDVFFRVVAATTNPDEDDFRNMVISGVELPRNYIAMVNFNYGN